MRAGVSQKMPTTTVNKMCGSGLKAVMPAGDQTAPASANIVLAGGIESMPNAPYLLPKARSWPAHGALRSHRDHMFFDGLQSPFDGKMMGFFADATAKKYGFTREQQDEFAAESVRARARMPSRAGELDAEVAPVTVQDRKGERRDRKDETPFTLRHCEDLPTSKPSIQQGRHGDGGELVVDLGGAAALVIASAAPVITRN